MVNQLQSEIYAPLRRPMDDCTYESCWVRDRRYWTLSSPISLATASTSAASILSLGVELASASADFSAASSSSSSSQLSLTGSAFLFSARFSARFAFFFWALERLAVSAAAAAAAAARLPGFALGLVSDEGGTQPMICPLGSAVRSAACCLEPRKRETSS